MPLRIQSAHGRPGNGPANLSKTAGAEGPKDLTLNPDEGPAQMGTRPSLRDREVAPIWFEPRRPDCD
ncbi:MAG: hypothetical protein WA796_05345 [Pseudolabrys sp.]